MLHGIVVAIATTRRLTLTLTLTVSLTVTCHYWKWLKMADPSEWRPLRMAGRHPSVPSAFVPVPFEIHPTCPHTILFRPHLSPEIGLSIDHSKLPQNTDWKQYSVTLVVSLSSGIKLIKMSCSWLLCMFFRGCQELKTKWPYGCTFSKHTPHKKFHPPVFPQLYSIPRISHGFPPSPTPCRSLTTGCVNLENRPLRRRNLAT